MCIRDRYSGIELATRAQSGVAVMIDKRWRNKIGSEHFLVIRKTHQDSWDALISNIEADVHGRQEVTY